MTSQINPDLLITTFPVAGKDNDSQGFRDNFAATKAGLQHAFTEISALQDKAILSQSLTGSATVDNDFGGSILSNGLYKQFDGVYHNGGIIDSPRIVNVSVGPVHKYIISVGTTLAPVVLTFTGWPATGHASSIRVMLVGDNVANRYIQFSTTNGGVIKPQTGLNFPYTIGTGFKYEIFDAWTVDGGSTIFLKHVGQF